MSPKSKPAIFCIKFTVKVTHLLDMQAKYEISNLLRPRFRFFRRQAKITRIVETPNSIPRATNYSTFISMTRLYLPYLCCVVVGLYDSSIPLSGALGAVDLQAVPHEDCGRGQQQFLSVLVVQPALDGLAHRGSGLDRRVMVLFPFLSWNIYMD